MTKEVEQFSMPFADAEERIGSGLMLGLVTDHRRFFTALEAGWMRPLPSRTGVLIGIGTYLNEVSEHSSKYPILIRSKIRATRLPDIGIHVLRNGRWVESRTSDIKLQDTAIHWPGPLPIFAISELCIQTNEQRARLSGLARSVSNLDLSPFKLHVDPQLGTCSEVAVDLPPNTLEFIIPDDYDVIHGALSMAIWGVPRTPPWMDLLVSSLSCDSDRLARYAAAVNASWLQHPAWIQVPDGERSDTQDCLWRAAIIVLRTQSPLSPLTPNELAEQITLRASQCTSKESSSAVVSRWKEATIRILRGDASISVDRWRDSPVGLAIQLLLTRTDPVMFREWFKDLPDLPPAVAWTATMLCGLLRGYQRLDIQFRGAIVQREVLALHALHLADPTNSVHALTAMRNDSLCWHNELGQFVLSHDGREFARKSENTRSKWYTTDFEDSKVRNEAKRFAKQRNWPCIGGAQLPSGRSGIHGPGQITVAQASQAIHGSGTVHMESPSSTTFSDVLDVGEFLRLVSVESGPIPEPPMLKDRSVRVQSGLVPGLMYVRDFISSDEEQRLMQAIDQCAWDTDSLRRRVQHYGWKYDYKERKVDINNRLGPLPDWAEVLAIRLYSSNLIEQLPNQVIVNDYRKNQGINKHIDEPEIFADGIAMLSLNESWEMVFRPLHSRDKVIQLLDRRSVAIMKGEARYKWTHEIPKRFNEPGRIKRVRRVSLTFRSVLGPN